MLKKLFCKHRHTIESHPACFAKGQVVITNNQEQTPWYQQEGYNICYLDIESDGLKADFSTMLTWCIKEKGGEIHYGKITKEELFNGTADKRLITDLVAELSKYRIVVGYYSKGFDVPYIRSKALHYDIPFLDYSFFHWDIFYSVKSKFNLARKSLDSVCDYLHIEGKTPIDKEVWRRAKYGDAEAVDKVLEHNQGDVIILEKLHERIEPFVKWTRSAM